MSDHERGSKKGKFCGVAGTPCDCGNDYVKNCGSPNWGNYTFKRLIRRQTGTISFSKTFEAHHLLCVASVADQIVAADGIDGVVRETTWCINAAKNMWAMPLWGHTVRHYCLISAAGGSILQGASAPPFANIPQHDYDHNCTLGYTHEVEKSLETLAQKVEEADHDVQTTNLAGRLNGLSDKFKSTLLERGLRNGGTDAGWWLGNKQPESRWYVPFSMASDACLTEKGFPVREFDQRVARWIKRIAEAMKTGGNA